MSLRNWETVSLDSLGSNYEPVLKAGPFGSSIVKSSYAASGYKLYGQQEVIGQTIDATGYYVSEETYAANRSCSVREGDVLITMMGTVGQTFVVPPIAKQGIINPRLMRIRVDEKQMDPYFLKAYLSSSAVQELLERRAHGGTMLGLNARSIGSIRVPVPPLPEQRKIAEILRTWDDAIELALSAQKTCLAISSAWSSDLLFGDPATTEIRSRYLLGELFDERNELGNANDKLLSVTQDRGIVDQHTVGRKNSSSTNRSKYKLVEPGDIAYNTMRMWQGASGLSSVRGIVSPAYTVVTPRAELINPKFAAHLFKSKEMTCVFERFSQGLTSDTWNLKFPAFARVEVQLPLLHRQIAIATYLDEAASEAEAYGRLQESLHTQKRGLMQKLLMGEIRVTGDSAASPEEASDE